MNKNNVKAFEGYGCPEDVQHKEMNALLLKWLLTEKIPGESVLHVLCSAMGSLLIGCDSEGDRLFHFVNAMQEVGNIAELKVGTSLTPRMTEPGAVKH